MEEKELEPEKSRRRLITGALWGIPILIGGTLTASAGNYLLGKQATQNDGWADAGDVSDIPAGSPCPIRFERAVVDAWKLRNEESSAWVILSEKREVTAFSPLCTHLGCAYRWETEDNVFSCPCHGSVFNVKGEVIAGPASRPLDQYSTKIEGNRLWLGPLRPRGE
jgi:quinol---cytochrome c reductase iron-sulfur subunit, bacillus type